ncbi:hypothetical protein [Nocardia carnea]|uniref:Uncharacterized protein n=1 Tax=Nocardia carnea TaxID=37328 RepID=A0ABW7TWH0_9NOCA
MVSGPDEPQRPSGAPPHPSGGVQRGSAPQQPPAATPQPRSGGDPQRGSTPQPHPSSSGPHNIPYEHRFPDDSRTTRSHAGESIEVARNWPGIILTAIGIVLVALTLTAAGYGFEGWAVIAGICGGVCLVAGIALVVVEHRRVKTGEGASLREQRGH